MARRAAELLPQLRGAGEGVIMMKVSLAEFVGGKEADDAYNKLCELTGLEWDAVRTCKNVSCDYDFVCSECDTKVFAVEGIYSAYVSVYQGDDEVGIRFCPACGAKVIN